MSNSPKPCVTGVLLRLPCVKPGVIGYSCGYHAPSLALHGYSCGYHAPSLALQGYSCGYHAPSLALQGSKLGLFSPASAYFPLGSTFDLQLPSQCGSTCTCRRRSTPSMTASLALVVMASVTGAEDSGFEIRLRRDFTSDFKIGTPLATLSGAWHCRVSTGTGRPGVSIL